jgi:general secretion pathway protein E
VLSTLHTNSAIAAVTRLIDMGVERFLLAPVLSGLVAQRLVRRLCTDCRRQDVAGTADAALLGGALKVGDPVWRTTGCTECGGQGYRGRLAVYEVIAVDGELERMIHEGSGEADLTAAVRARTPGLIHDAADKIRAGDTSVEEAARVARDD